MNGKIVLLGIAVVAVGLVALPNTFALFKGQHDWYATNLGTDGLPCQKCHQDVIDEFYGADTTTTAFAGHSNGGTLAGSPQLACEFCHITGITGGTTYPTAQTDFHAATSPLCLDCHSAAGGAAGSAEALLNGANESHKDFAVAAAGPDVTFLNGANEACVACHTHVPVNITWQKKTTMTLTAKEAAGTGSKWTISNFVASGAYNVKTVGAADGTGTVVINPTTP